MMLSIAFIAHDRKKEEMVNFAIAYENVSNRISSIQPVRQVRE